MLGFIKDSLKPSNWFKLLKEPSKINVIANRLSYYPGLKFAYSKSSIYRFLEIFITIFLAKKNKTIKNFFFSKNEKTIDNIVYKFNLSENLLSQAIECLKTNGIVVLEDVLAQNDFYEIKDLVEESLSEKNYNKILNIEDENIKKTTTPLPFLLDENLLIKISDFFSKNVYGQIVNPNIGILKTVAKKIPEKNIKGDNIYHPDRYLPNIKAFYYIEEVNESSAPFMYALGSHKITTEYLEFFYKNPEWIFDETNEKALDFLKFKRQITVKKNSMIFACTNGFHGRSKFLKLDTRTALVFTYPKFNLKSLISFSTINKLN